MVAALVAANPANVKPISDAEFAKMTTPQGRLTKLGLTVISVSLASKPNIVSVDVHTQSHYSIA